MSSPQRSFTAKDAKGAKEQEEFTAKDAKGAKESSFTAECAESAEIKRF
jgi:hypothetical protein